MQIEQFFAARHSHVKSYHLAVVNEVLPSTPSPNSAHHFPRAREERHSSAREHSRRSPFGVSPQAPKPSQEPCFHPLPKGRNSEERFKLRLAFGVVDLAKFMSHREWRQVRLGAQPIPLLDFLSGLGDVEHLSLSVV
jgi:hypothetical protein